jgi:signal transduction histidine kinase
MTEMRELLVVLRDPDAEPETAPQPGFDEIGALVASVRRAGLPVDARIVTTAPVSTAVGQVAYRIVQEALSNVLKHAPGQATAVEVAGDRDRLVIDVVNGPDASAGATPGPGSRVAVARAEASAGRSPDQAPATRPRAAEASAAEPAADAILGGGGHGILGMRERARLVGGTIEVGPTPGGGFGVHAVLPPTATAEERP